MISLDTETTGSDFYHGAKPYFVTTCDEEGVQQWWEWDVDPMTRNPIIPKQDIVEIKELIRDSDEYVLQGTKFDVTALNAGSSELLQHWDWSKVRDTLLAGHLLDSGSPHDLTSMCLQYLGIDVQKYEDAVEEATKKARAIVSNKGFITVNGKWAIAKAGRPDMPSAGNTVWKLDMWLPRALAKKFKYPKDHPWWNVTAEYANSDSAVTVSLWKVMWHKIQQRGLEKIYFERLKVLPIAYTMESKGVTLNRFRKNKQCKEYVKHSQSAKEKCEAIAKGFGYDLEMPGGANNNSLRHFVFGYTSLTCPNCGKESRVINDHKLRHCIKCLPPEKVLKASDTEAAKCRYIRKHNPCLNVPQISISEATGDPSLDQTTINTYLDTLPKGSPAHEFMKELQGKRKRDTAISYMDSYERFWVPHFTKGPQCIWYKLHPNLNPTGTSTLRWSSNNPNEQNISKKEGFNLRYLYGPAPGREWWSLDAKNIELRLPAYEAGETEMINLFERPKDPPYFGSNHLLIFDTIKPKLFAKYGAKVKELFEDTWYQWTKNGNFAVQYMAGEATADRAYHVPGAFAKVKGRFAKIHGPGGLNDRVKAFADKHGYVETMIDKSVDPTKGYPLICSRGEYGKIKPTLPLNYRVQGTACWWMMKAMIRCQEYLWELYETYRFDGFITMQIHDELVFDFPKGTGEKPWLTNLPKIRKIRKLMEQGGIDIGVPTPTSCEYHATTWAEGMSL